MTIRTVGLFDEAAAPALTAAAVELPALDMLVEWRRCGITADYFGDYLAYAFERREIARTVISTAANELLENAAKFSSDKRSPVRAAVRLRGGALELEVENQTDAAHIERLTTVLDAIAAGDAAVLFTERI
jgi:hypothetical protein